MRREVKYFLWSCIAIMIGFCNATPILDQVLCINNGLLCSRNRTIFPCVQENLECCQGREPGHYVPQSKQMGFACCEGSGELYDTSVEVCENRAIRRQNTPTETMCGVTAVVDTATQECCMKNDSFGRVYDKGGMCCDDDYITDTNLSCCGGRIYNLSNETCCRTIESTYVLHNISNGKCCLNVPYQPATHDCDYERGVVQKDENDIERCYGKPYDPARDFCCGDQVASRSEYLCYKDGSLVPKPLHSYHHNKICLVRNGKLLTYYLGEGSKVACLEGDRIVRLRKDEGICMDGPRNIYNTTTDLCCAEEIYYKNGKSQKKRCCGPQAYNPDSEICCFGNSITNNVSESQGGRCCGKNGYDPSFQKCNASRQIVDDECADESKPPYSERCHLTVPKIRKLAKTFHKKGLSVYIGTIVEELDETPPKKSRSKKQPMRNWRLSDVEQLKGKKKIKIVSVKGEELTVMAQKCRCPNQLEIGERYIFFTKKSIRNGELTLNAMEETVNRSTDAVIPLSQATNLGRIMEILFNTD